LQNERNRIVELRCPTGSDIGHVLLREDGSFAFQSVLSQEPDSIATVPDRVLEWIVEPNPEVRKMICAEEFDDWERLWRACRREIERRKNEMGDGCDETEGDSVAE